MARTPTPRHERILALLERRDHVTVAALAQELGVSEVTIRKDLDGLARSSLVERVRGGARLRSGDEGVLAERIGYRVTAKRAVAQRAAEFIETGAVIALDSSSTCYYLALELIGRTDITVVTNSLRVATQLADHSQLDIVLLGGTVRRTSSSTVGFPAELLQGFGRIDIAFLGVSALSAQQGLLERAFSEAETKRMMASASDRVIGLFDSSKTAGFGQHGVVPASSVTRLITDDAFAEAEVKQWTAIGTQVDRVTVTTG